jgi:hypothetical protein
MKKLFVLCISISLVIILNSNSFGYLEFKVGAKGGGGIGFIVVDGYSDSNAILIPTGGGFVELAFKGDVVGIGIEIGFMYQKRGGEFSDGTETIDYFGIPIMVKLYSPIVDWVWLGVGVNYQTLLSYAHPLSYGDIDVKRDNLEVIFAIGIDIPITDRIGFLAELRGSVGLLNYSSNPRENLKTAALEALLGISVRVF